MNTENAKRERHNTPFALHEKLLAAEEFEQQLAREGRVPDVRKLLVRRTAGLLQVLGGVIVALLVALLAIVLTFFVFNKLLHIGV